MAEEQTLKQLLSSSIEARNAALRHFRRTRHLPEAARAEIMKLFDTGPPYLDDLVTVIVEHPGLDFERSYRILLTEGTVSEQSQALQCLPLWLKSQGHSFATQLQPVLMQLSTGSQPWIAFLAAVQRARLYAGGNSAWRQAAEAIRRADGQAWYASIRPQVEEIVSLQELRLLNDYLRALGSPELKDPHMT